MKAIHWLILACAVWVAAVPFLGNDLLWFLGDATTSLVAFLKMNNAFLGLGIGVLSLLAVSTDAVSPKTDRVRATHWVVFGLSVWLGVAPVALSFTAELFGWNNLIIGILIGIYCLVQLNLEKR